jgi:haloalkane dehalogenase
MRKISVLDTIMAYVDTDTPTQHLKRNASPVTVVYLHGNPTSSYLYRNIIPHVSPIARCIAPDLVGFGNSGKMPSNTYKVRDHVRYFGAFMDAVVPEEELGSLFLVIHDWGSALGFDWSRKHEKRIAGLIFMEFIPAHLSWDDFAPDPRELFRKFRNGDEGRKMIIDENIFIDVVLGQSGTVRTMTDVEMRHYRTPFLEPAMREPVYQFPNEIPFDGAPLDVAEMVETYQSWLLQSDVPKLMFWAEPGALIPIPKAEWFLKHLKNVTGVNIGPGTHYVQEDNPHLIGEQTRMFVQRVVTEVDTNIQ